MTVSTRGSDIHSERYTLHRGDALDAYDGWDRPDMIMSDGAYGVRGFKGDTVSVADLKEWYQPHVEAWSRYAKPSTSLWLWNTEIGWATVHPLLEANGWEYVQTVTWDKGLSHVAGNVNSGTIRRFPVVTEISALYRRRLLLPLPDGTRIPVREWLHEEWERTGLPFCRANTACHVKCAATRKYLATNYLWYRPSGEMVQAMAEYANENGKATRRPYFSLDGRTPVTAAAWDALRAPWNHVNGITNVWSRPSLHTSERIKGTLRRSAPRVHTPTAASAAHLNQKPLDLMDRQIHATTNEGDVIWEPFGGLASASVAAVLSDRRACAAEVDDLFHDLALERLCEAEAKWLVANGRTHPVVAEAQATAALASLSDGERLAAAQSVVTA